MASKITRGTTGQADADPSNPTLRGNTSNSTNGFPQWQVIVGGQLYNNHSPGPGGFNLTQDGQITVPVTAPLGSFTARYTTANPITVPPATLNDWNYTGQIVCMAEVVTVGSPTWNATTNQWDYPVTVSIQGGTSPFTPSRPSTTTVSLAPGDSTTFSSSTTDSGSCSASSSTPIGPAPIPPGGPSQGPGPSGPDGSGPDGPNDAGDGGTGDDGDGGHPPCQTCLCPEKADGSRPDCSGDLNQPRMQRHSQYGQAMQGHISGGMNIAPSAKEWIKPF